MVDFYDDEHKALAEINARLCVLLSEIGKGKKPLKAVKPELMVFATGTKEAPEVTAVLAVVVTRGATPLEAVTSLETAVRISAHGEHREPDKSETQIEVITCIPDGDEATLAEVVGGDSCSLPRHLVN